MGIVQDFKKMILPKKKQSGNNMYIDTFGGIDWFFKGDFIASNPTLENIYHKFANDISLISVQHIIKESEDSWKMEEYSDINYVLSFRPNPTQSQADFFYCIGYSLFKYGNVVIIPTVSDTGLTQLDIIPMTFKMKVIDNYLYLKSDDTKEIKISMSRVIYIRNRPYNLFENSDINLSNYISILDANTQAMMNKLSTSGILRGLLKLSTSLKPEELENRRKNFVTSLDSSGIGALDMGQDFTELKNTYYSLDPEAQKQINNEIYKTFGLNEDIFIANATEQQNIAYYNSVLEPTLKKLEQAFNYGIFSRKKWKEGNVLTMTLPKFDAASQESWTDYAGEMVYQGIQNVNELRKQISLPPIPGGNIFRTNKNATELNPKDRKQKGGD